MANPHPKHCAVLHNSYDVDKILHQKIRRKVIALVELLVASMALNSFGVQLDEDVTGFPK